MIIHTVGIYRASEEKDVNVFCKGTVSSQCFNAESLCYSLCKLLYISSS